MRFDAIKEGFWIFEDSDYACFLRMQALRKVLNIPEYGWIMPYGRVLNNALSLVNVSKGFK